MCETQLFVQLYCVLFCNVVQWYRDIVLNPENKWSQNRQGKNVKKKQNKKQVGKLFSYCLKEG